VLVFLSLERTFRRAVAIIPRAVRTNQRSERDLFSVVLVFLSLERTFRRAVAIIPRAVRTNRSSEQDLFSVVPLFFSLERTSGRLVRLGASSVRHFPESVVARTRSVTLDGDGEADGAWSVCARLREGWSCSEPLRYVVPGDRLFAGPDDAEGNGEREVLVEQGVLRDGERHGRVADDTVVDDVLHLARERLYGRVNERNTVTHSEHEWLDLEDYESLTARLNVREVSFATGISSINLNLQTSPSRDETLFMTMTSSYGVEPDVGRRVLARRHRQQDPRRGAVEGPQDRRA
jgi:hypothetical protein